MFEPESTWKSFKERFQVYKWLAKAKQLQHNFQTLVKDLAGSQFSDFYRKIFRTENFYW
jgi:hypothetical protein